MKGQLPAAPVRLRRGLLAAALPVHAALAVSRLVPGYVVAIAVVLQVVGAEWAGRRSLPQHRIAQVFVNSACAAVTVMQLVLLRQRAQGSGPSTLPYLIVAVAAFHPAVWRRVRDLQTGIAVTFGELLVVAAFGSGSTVGVFVVAAWPGLLWITHECAAAAAVLRGTGGRQLPAVRAVATSGAAARRLPLARTVAAVLVGLLVFAALPDVRGLHLASYFAHRTASGEGSLSTPPLGDPLSRASGAAAYVSGQLDLRNRGELPTTPLLEVPADSPTLWRAAVYTVYDGTSWIDPYATVGPTFYPLPYSRAAQPPTAERYVARRLSAAPVVYAPGQDVLRLSAVGADATRPATVSVSGQSLVLGRTDGLPPEVYAVDVVVPSSDPATLRARGRPSYASGTLTTVPAALPDRVRRLAHQLTDAAPTTYDAVVAVETYLRTHERYRLDSPLPGSDDAVDAFLFRDHVGFCEQFASAETVLLRAVGIPARLATGLAYGDPGGTPGTRVYRGSNLHAWVEVYYPGVGWVSSDPTAGAAADPVSSPKHSLANAIASIERLVGRLPGGRFTAVAILLLLLLGVWAAAPVARRLAARVRARLARATARRSTATMSVPDGRGSAATRAFRRLLARLASAGRPRREVETLRDLQARLRLPEQAVATLEQEWYGELPPTPAASEHAAAELDQVGQAPG